MDNDYSAYLLAKWRVAQLHAEARAAHLAAVAQSASAGGRRAPQWVAVLRRRHVPAWLAHPASAKAGQ